MKTVEWEYTHHRQEKLIQRDGWMCETHPGESWPHDGCPGPGMPWMIEGKEAITKLLHDERQDVYTAIIELIRAKAKVAAQKLQHSCRRAHG